MSSDRSCGRVRGGVVAFATTAVAGDSFVFNIAVTPWSPADIDYTINAETFASAHMV
jgi:hypothetical protein